MPAAVSKDELLAVTEKEFAKLEKLLASIPADASLVKDDEDTSIKDLIAHRAHWIDLFLGWYRDGQAGKEVFFPAKGYKWNELKAYNAVLRQKQSTIRWKRAVKMLQERHRALLDFIETHCNDELYGGPMKGANNNWTPGRWAEAAGSSHYRSAAKYIRQRLKEFR